MPRSLAFPNYMSADRWTNTQYRVSFGSLILRVCNTELRASRKQMVKQPEKYAIFKWPPLLKVVTFCTNKEVRLTSGHLSEATRTNSTEEFRQYEARKKKGLWGRKE